MILVKNRQRSIVVDVVWIERVMASILKKSRYENFDIAVIIINDRAMRAFNKKFRAIDRSTDVLSFPFHSGRIPGKRIRVSDAEEAILGDILLSAPYSMRKSVEHNVSFEHEIRTLLVHGFFHLCGYDHITDSQYRQMRRAELRMLSYLDQQAL